MANDVIRKGSLVIVSGGFGTELPQLVEVEEVGSKNGKPLIDYTDLNGSSRWAYFSQIVEVVIY